MEYKTECLGSLEYCFDWIVKHASGRITARSCGECENRRTMCSFLTNWIVDSYRRRNELDLPAVPLPPPDPVLKLAVRFREGSASIVGIPVAEVVVVHVLVDIRRKRLGGTKRFPLYTSKQCNQWNGGRGETTLLFVVSAKARPRSFPLFVKRTTNAFSSPIQSMMWSRMWDRWKSLAEIVHHVP